MDDLIPTGDLKLPQTGAEIFQLTSQIRFVITAVEQSVSKSNQALFVAENTSNKLDEFCKFAQPILEGKNRISSNQIRILKRTVEARVRHFAEANDILKKKYFKSCYRSIHDACLVNTITDIPENLYEHALRCAREWEPITYEG